MPELIKRGFTATGAITKDLGEGVVEVVVATEALDRHGEKVSVKGLNLKGYSGVVLWGHDYDNPPIGKSISIRKTADGRLISKTQFAINEYPFANTVYKLVAGGFAPDVSIGFIPKTFDEKSSTWTKADMIEYSHVTIGANPEAKVTAKALKEIGLSQEDFRGQYQEHILKVKAIEAGIVGKDLEETDESEVIPPDVEVVEDPPEIIDETEDTQVKPLEDEPDEEDPQELTPEVKDSLRHNLSAIRSLLSAAESELDSYDTDERPPQIKRILLVRAKQTAVSIDRIVESAIGELNNRLDKE